MYTDSLSPELDKVRGTAKTGFGGSPFGSSSVPPEFTPLVSAHQTVSKLSKPLTTTISTANEEYEKQTDPAVSVPSAPVYAARLNGLLKTLANAESAVADCVKAREGLISGLEKMLGAQKSALAEDQSTSSELQKRKGEIEEKKQQVEVAIMRALGPSEGNGTPAEGGSASPPPEPDRPEMEALTPPAMEAFTPPAMESLTPPPMESLTPPPGGEHADVADQGEPQEAGQTERTSSYHSLPVSTNGSNKRRRLEDSGEFPEMEGDEGIDKDVTEMLKDDSNGN